MEKKTKWNMSNVGLISRTVSSVVVESCMRGCGQQSDWQSHLPSLPSESLECSTPTLAVCWHTSVPSPSPTRSSDMNTNVMYH